MGCSTLHKICYVIFMNIEQYKPKVIKIFLLDGTPTGVKIAEVGNRTIKGIVIPRNRLKSVKDRLDKTQPSVYFLIGESEETGEIKVYVGEAENLYKRLITHDNTKEKQFWHTVLAFVSKDKNLTKAHVKFLESKCIEILKKTNRCEIANSIESTETTLPDMDIAEMGEFIEDLQILASTLGFQIFTEIPKIKEEEIYLCKGKGVEARGALIDEGFVVFKNSQATVNEAKTIGKWLKNVRKNLIERDILRQEGDNYIFTKDYIFGSPSTAAGVILGCRVNGWLLWKNKKGKTIDEIMRKK